MKVMMHTQLRSLLLMSVFVNMFILIQFKGDGEYKICKINEVKWTGTTILAKWKNRFYDAIKILSSEDHSILDHWMWNLSNNSPTVILHRCDDLHIERGILAFDNSDQCSLNVSIHKVSEAQRMDDFSHSICENNEVTGLNGDNYNEKCSTDWEVSHSDEDSSYKPDSSDRSSDILILPDAETGLNETTSNTNTVYPDVLETLAYFDNTHQCSFNVTNHKVSEAQIMDDFSHSICEKNKVSELDCDNYNEKCPTDWEDFHSDEDSSYKPDSSDMSSDALIIPDAETRLNETTSNTNTELCFICGKMVNNLKNHVKDHGSFNTSLNTSPLQELELQGRRRQSKYHYCLYCGIKQTKLNRHLERKHTDQEDVRFALGLTKGCSKRSIILDDIRKKGDYLHNRACPDQPVTVRKSLSGSDYMPCPNCSGYFSKKNLRRHVKSHCKSSNIGSRKILSKSRLMTFDVHKDASTSLKDDIFVNMKHDEVFQITIKDETIVRYGNMLLIKYSSSTHHHKMITQQLRNMSRLLLSVNKNNCLVTTVKDLLKPANFDDLIKGIHTLAGLKDGKYKAPSVANHSCTLVMHFIEFLKCESIKENNQVLRKDMEDIHCLMQHSQNAFVTKIAGENRTHSQRTKIEVIPNTEEMNILFKLLAQKSKKLVEDLTITFNRDTWSQLCKITLIGIMTFNRKRPGDVEKTQIVEYNSLKRVSEEEALTLGISEKNCALQFGRFITRGKLNRPAPTLVSTDHMQAIDIMLQHREAAGVPADNKYLFGTIVGSKYQYFKADKALKDFCLANNLSETKFTATKFRKHLATVTSTTSRDDQLLISDFMGHHIDIHNNIYRQRQANTDIIKMGKVLTDAIGGLQKENHEEPSTTGLKSPPTTEVYSFLKEQVDEFPIESPDHSSNNDYFHDLSTIQESPLSTPPSTPPPCTSLLSHFPRRNRMNRKPYSRKHTWRTPERKLVRDSFKWYIENKKVPSLKQCQDIARENLLDSRSPQQVRAWIAAQIKRSSNESSHIKPGWSTPSKKICREYFKQYYITKSYPPLTEMRHAIDTIPDFANKTTNQIRSHLQHDYKYLDLSKI